MENKPLSEIVNGGELYHYGVLGMRWGFRRFQPYSLIPRKSGKGGKETGAAKKASKRASKMAKSSGSVKKASSVKVSEVKKSRNQKSADAAKAREEEAKTARERRERIEKIVRSGDINLIYENRKDLSESQLKQAISRIDTEKQVAELYRKANPTTLDKITGTTTKLKDLNDNFDQIARGYNNFARTVNMLTGEDTGETMRFIKNANTGGKNPKKLKDNKNKNSGNSNTNVNNPGKKLKKKKNN